MSESVIADFVGSFNSEVTTRPEPIKGRIVLSQRRVVLAANESDKLTIPLAAIFDIAVGHVPPDLGDFFNSTVTIAFERGDRRVAAAIEADDDTIDKFATVLFKVILNGTETTIKRRARVGGRVTDEDYATASLQLSQGAIAFRRGEDEFVVDLDGVAACEQVPLEVDGNKRAVLVVRHLQDGIVVTTHLAIPSSRKMAILARYLRTEYSDVVATINDLAVDDTELEMLVAIYSAGDASAGQLAGILDLESVEASLLVSDLAGDGLVRDEEGGPTLTPEGVAVTIQQLDRVDD